MPRLPSSVYVHVPFCRARCRYCDFHSDVSTAEGMAEYLDGLEIELGRLPRPPIARTLHIGGGTPTALPFDLLERFLDLLASNLRLHRLEEFTFEVNPGTLTSRVIKLLLDRGVNRISLGVQTFDDRLLRFLGRVHDAAAVHSAIQALRTAGVRNLGIDLICCIPGGTRDSWRRDLDEALSFEPEHISAYTLSIEPGTAFADWLDDGRLQPVSEDLGADLYEMADEILVEAGYEHYEISNFAQPGHESRHNLGTWRNRPYLGLGPAAASYVDGVRWRNVESTLEYVRRLRAGDEIAEDHEKLSRGPAAGESMMLALRLSEGVTAGEIRRRHGIDPLVRYRRPIARFRKAGLLTVTRGRIRLTPRGRMLADEVLAAFVTPERSEIGRRDGT
jgi:putative oxygen-independent coproporphyrinogen III oxidase